jgi:hypothetical protein
MVPAVVPGLRLEEVGPLADGNGELEAADDARG